MTLLGGAALAWPLVVRATGRGVTHYRLPRSKA
jgi:hypothetical protein